MYAKQTGEIVVDIAPPTDPAKIVHVARDRFEEGKTKPLKFRKKQLNGLLKFVQENQNAIIEAVYRDFRKPKQEVVCYEIVPVVKELKHAINHLKEWAKPEKPKKSMVNLLDGVMVYNDPYGVVLVMGAWNYPFQLTLMPVIG